MSYIRDRAIVLRKRTVRQADRWYTLLCLNEGKVDVLVKSAAKSSSKLAGHLELGVKTEIMLANGRTKLHLASAKVVNTYILADKSYQNMIIKWSALNIANSLVYGNESSQEVFLALDDFLARLSVDHLSWQQKVQLLDLFLTHCLVNGGWCPDINNLTNNKDGQIINLLGLFFNNDLPWTNKVESILSAQLNNDLFGKTHKIIDNYYRQHI